MLPGLLDQTLASISSLKRFSYDFTCLENCSPPPRRPVERELLAAPFEKGNCVRWDGAKSFPRKNGGKWLMLDWSHCSVIKYCATCVDSL